MNRLSLAFAILCLAGGSASAFAGPSKDKAGAVYRGTWDAQKARHEVGAVYRGTWDAQKARHQVGAVYRGSWDAQKARHEVGAVYRGTWDAQKARHHVGGRYTNAVQERHVVADNPVPSKDTGLNLNEGF